MGEIFGVDPAPDVVDGSDGDVPGGGGVGTQSGGDGGGNEGGRDGQGLKHK